MGQYETWTSKYRKENMGHRRGLSSSRWSEHQSAVSKLHQEYDRKSIEQMQASQGQLDQKARKSIEDMQASQGRLDQKAEHFKIYSGSVSKESKSATLYGLIKDHQRMVNDKRAMFRYFIDNVVYGRW